jgi:hypothetical protein
MTATSSDCGYSGKGKLPAFASDEPMTSMLGHFFCRAKVFCCRSAKSIRLQRHRHDLR